MGIRDIFPGEELMVITRKGIMIRIALDSVSQQSRNTQGVRIINLKKDDLVGSIAKISLEAVAEMEDGDTDENGQEVNEDVTPDTPETPDTQD